MKVIREAIKSIESRQETCWAMARVFMQNRDAHGVHDMGVEIQALDRAKTELENLFDR